MNLNEALRDRKALAEKLRQYLPHCGKQDMTNHEKDLVEWVDQILAEPGNAQQRLEPDNNVL